MMAGPKHVSSPHLMLERAKIVLGELNIIADKVQEIRSLGLQEGSDGNRLSIEQTKYMISLIRGHVSFTVSIIMICLLIFALYL